MLYLNQAITASEKTFSDLSYFRVQRVDNFFNVLINSTIFIFDFCFNFRDLGRNRLHCDWQIWWLVNFTKSLESFSGYCFSPKSLRGRDIRKLTEKDVIGIIFYYYKFHQKLLNVSKIHTNIIIPQLKLINVMGLLKM